MKVGFNMLLWTTHVTKEHLPLLKTLKKVGYDGVEIPVFGGDAAHFEKIGKAIKDNGLAPSNQRRRQVPQAGAGVSKVGD
jgi:D-psicose/D-tagatose/L-ribulose 3-epimerase